MTVPAWRSPADPADAPPLFDPATPVTDPEPTPDPPETSPADADEPRVPRERTPSGKPRRVRDTRNMGHPRVGTGKVLGPYETPQELRDLVLRYQSDQGFGKQADAVRTLLVAGLWAEGYDEAETLQDVVVGAAPVLRYQPADGLLRITRGNNAEDIAVTGFAGVDAALAERGLERRGDQRGQWREDSPGVWVAVTRKRDARPVEGSQ